MVSVQGTSGTGVGKGKVQEGLGQGNDLIGGHLVYFHMCRILNLLGS